MTPPPTPPSPGAEPTLEGSFSHPAAPSLHPYTRASVWVAFTLLLALAVTDYANSSDLDYVGTYAALPFLVAIFAPPARVVAVGIASLGVGYLLGYLVEVGDTPAQMVRLAAITLATLVAAYAARLREERESRLAAVTHVAEVAQRTLLRPVPDSLGRLECAVRYHSAAEEARIGGDLYEVVETQWGVRVILGDVRGKGLAAVQVASEVLGAFRHLAQTEEDLEVVVAGLDAAAARSGGVEDFVTALVVQLYDSSLQVLNCGHPSPVTLRPSGPAFLEPASHSPPLGLGATPDVLEVPFEPGDSLLLYTDGLTEARNREGEFFPVLSAAVALSEGPAEGLASLTRQLRKHVGDRLDDDVAMLAFKLS